MLSFFPRGVLDEILNLIESVSEGFPSYFWLTLAKNEFAFCCEGFRYIILDSKYRTILSLVVTCCDAT